MEYSISNKIKWNIKILVINEETWYERELKEIRTYGKGMIVAIVISIKVIRRLSKSDCIINMKQNIF